MTKDWLWLCSRRVCGEEEVLWAEDGDGLAFDGVCGGGHGGGGRGEDCERAGREGGSMFYSSRWAADGRALGALNVCARDRCGCGWTFEVAAMHSNKLKRKLADIGVDASSQNVTQSFCLV
jgi:hypothetical protein